MPHTKTKMLAMTVHGILELSNQVPKACSQFVEHDAGMSGVDVTNCIDLLDAVMKLG